MPDIVLSGEAVKIARKARLRDQEGHDLWNRTGIHGLHDRTVFDALKDATPKVCIVGIEGLNLDRDSAVRPVIDDIDSVCRIQNDFGICLDIGVVSSNPSWIVSDPESEVLVVFSFAMSCVSDSVTFSASGRGEGRKPVAERILVDTVPIGKCVHVSADFIKCVAPLVRFVLAKFALRKLWSVQIYGHVWASTDAGHAVALLHEQDIEERAVFFDLEHLVH